MKLLRHYKDKANNLTAVDLITLSFVTAAFILAIAVAGTYVKARYFTGLSRIEVPVATVKDVYEPNELIEGLFFGEVKYNGRVDYTRQLICPNYSEFVKDINTGKNVVNGSATPRKLTGARSPVGYASAGVPTGVNCTIQFKNLYCIPYLFGCVNREYSYYTSTFQFKTPQVSTNSSDNKPSQTTDQITGNTTSLPRRIASNQSGSQSQTQNSSQPSVTNNTTTNNTTNNNNATTQTREVCDPLVNLLGIRIGQVNCRQETVTQ